LFLDNGIVHHDPPLLFNLRNDPGETTPLSVEDYHELIVNISAAREKHIENRTRKWISQFEYPILPWLFPCANFPYCHRRDHAGKLKHIVFDNESIF
jgi:steryl-sulfatase/arylsulfatase D/F/H